jgi:protein-glucosylgalactosylhydroxylysine glucosidase
MMKNILTLFAVLLCGLSVFAQDPWKITASKIDASKYYGITSANGVLGILSSPQPLKVDKMVLAGTYDNWGETGVAKFLPTLNFMDIDLSVDGNKIGLDDIKDYQQTFNLRYGMMEASFIYGNKLKVEYSYCVLRQLPYDVFMDVKLTALTDVDIQVSHSMVAPSPLKNCEQIIGKVEAHQELHPLLATAQSPHNQLTIGAASMLVLPKGKSPVFTHDSISPAEHQFSFNLQIKKNENFDFSLVGAVISTKQYSNPSAEALRLAIYAALEGKDQLLADHKKAWDELWQSDITIDGDKQSQQDVHSMLYHLYAFTRANTDYSPSPMGLSGFGYNGHVFWDTELWMYPALLPLHANLAKSEVEYRYNRLDAAKRNAFANGYQGAMYPWESADDGTEETPAWVLTGMFEQHITACVGIAAWNYYLATQDEKWLKEKGWPVLKATAEFWVSRATKSADGKYNILNVVCADEYAQNVDNNAFTNAAAIKNLSYAIQCAQKLGYQMPETWTEVCNGLKIEKMDNGVTAEYKGYNGKTIKQADVNLLAYPLNIITDKAQIAKDLQYYEKKVDYGVPAMTQAIFSILSNYLGDSASAYKYFKDAYVMNELPPFGVLAETQGGTNPYFSTGAGGALQAVIYGFGGLRISPNGGFERITSCLPKAWKRLTITGVGKNKETIVVEGSKN